MTNSINEVRKFLTENKLCNNEDKTEVIITGSKQNLKKVIFDSLKVGVVTVQTVDKARNLKCHFDQHLDGSQVKNICKTGYFHIKNIASLRNSHLMRSAQKLLLMHLSHLP